MVDCHRKLNKQSTFVAAATLSLMFSNSTVLANDDLLDLPLEELLNIVVKVASKKNESVKDAPGVISVITRKEIEDFGGTSLVDILNRAPSLQIMSSHLWVQAKSVIRGNLITHTDKHTLILINGRPFRDALQTNSNFAFYNSFPVDLIERIEIMRSPGSVLYGSNATGGVINVITKTSKKEYSSKATAGIGSFGARLGTITTLVKKDKSSLSLGINYFDEEGWDFNAATNHPSLGPVTDSKKYAELNKSISAFYDYDDKLSAQLFYSDSKYENLGLIPYWSREGYVQGRRLFFDIGYRQPLNERWDAKLNLTRNTYNKHIFDQVGGDNMDNTHATILELSFAGNIADKDDIVFGVSAERRENYDISESMPGIELSSIPQSYVDNYYALYMQADYRLIVPLKLTAGAQYISADGGESHLVPRVGGIYTFRDNMSLKVLYGEAFRSPVPSEEYINLPGVLIGTSGLEHEIVKTTDIQLFIDTSIAEYSLTYFHSTYEDLIERVAVSVGSSTQTFQNAGDIKLSGFELEAKVQVAAHVYVTGSYIYQKEKNDSLSIPDFMFKSGVSYQRGAWTVGLFDSVFGKPKENNPLGNLELNPKADVINLLSANLKYTFHTKIPMDLEIFGTNLLDDNISYTEFSRGWTNTLPIGPGRAVYSKLSLFF